MSLAQRERSIAARPCAPLSSFIMQKLYRETYCVWVGKKRENFLCVFSFKSLDMIRYLKWKFISTSNHHIMCVWYVNEREPTSVNERALEKEKNWKTKMIYLWQTQKLTRKKKLHSSPVRRLKNVKVLRWEKNNLCSEFFWVAKKKVYPPLCPLSEVDTSSAHDGRSRVS